MEVKIKRLLAGGVNGLSIDDVAVISDRSRLAEITLQPSGEMIDSKSLQQNYVSIWGLILTKSSLTRFRLIFFSLIILLLLTLGALGWLIYKFYPHMRLRKEESSETFPPGPGF